MQYDPAAVRGVDRTLRRANLSWFWWLSLDKRHGHQLLPDGVRRRGQLNDNEANHRNWRQISSRPRRVNEPDSESESARNSSVRRDHPGSNLAPAAAYSSWDGSRGRRQR